MTTPAATLPLLGQRVLVTRSREQSHDLSSLLRAAGASPLELPSIAIHAAPSEPIDDALERLATYDWVVLTSVNGVKAVFERLDALGLSASAFEVTRVAAIGRATAEALRKRGVEVAFMPERFVAEAVVEGLAERGIRGKHVLLPRADIARDALPEGLRAAGATVDIVVAYRTGLPDRVPAKTLEALRSGDIDVVTFGSPSAVRNLCSLLGGELPSRVVVACIGPITADEARRSGLRVDVVAHEYSMPGLVEALVQFVKSQPERGS